MHSLFYLSMEQSDIQQSFRRLLIRNVILPLITGFISICIFVSMINTLIDRNKEVENTNQVIALANATMKNFVDGETGIRGFALTGKNEFLDPYVRSTARIPADLKNLKSKFADNKLQEDRVIALEGVYETWIEYAENVKKNREQNKNMGAVVGQGFGKTMMDQSRDIFDKIITREERVRSDKTEAMNNMAYNTILIVSFVLMAISIFIALYGKKQMTELAQSYESLLKASQERNEVLRHQQWIKNGQNELGQAISGARNIDALAQSVSSYISRYLDAQVGVFYLKTSDKTLERKASYAFAQDSVQNKFIQFGETLVGQAALEKRLIHIKNLPIDYVKVSSAIGNHKPHQLMIVPLVDDDQIIAVLEFGFLSDAEKQYEDFFNAISEILVSSIKAVQFREQRERLLSEIQNQAEELQSQQEELRVMNEELEEQTRNLKITQTSLESQYAEMEQTNTQLEEQTQILENQKDQLDRKNDSLNDAKRALEQKAEELQKASQYKTEFLANMSHELRTPLNSSLILAKLLADNKDRNLTAQQVEFANQILSSANDLLNLINDILDLSKVEAGKLDIVADDVPVSALTQSLQKSFQPLAQEKGLDFKFKIESYTPATFITDRLRIEQILKNLISNAIKFTSQGSVSVNVSSSRIHGSESQWLRFDVKDTGIGVKKEQQEVIFEAFRQADGTTNRKFGGTGLGLSISKDLARLLGGQIKVESTPNEGSTFTLLVPQDFRTNQESAPSVVPLEVSQANTFKLNDLAVHEKAIKKEYFSDDRLSIASDKDRILLVVEDDKKFAQILFDMAHERQYKCLVTDSPEEAIELTKRYHPVAILLDVRLGGQNGLFVLDRLKQDSQTRHIPIHVISAEDYSRLAIQMGAIGHMMKPVAHNQLLEVFEKVDQKVKQRKHKVLIVEDNKVQSSAIQKLIEDKSLETMAVESGQAAIDILNKVDFDCMIMDLNLPDMSGFDLVDKMNEMKDNNKVLPAIIVYTGKSLSRDEEHELNRHSRSVIIKSALSPERLLDEVTLFLHRYESDLDAGKQDMLQNLRHREKIFENRVVMVVDDDMRNTFALTAALEQKGAKVVIAKNGQESLEKLSNEKIVDIVLMDIMMPIMDGYEAIRQIRKQDRFKKLPIIALTAKAMKDDQQLCLDAGANDYLAKPIDLDKLMSLVKIWMTAGWSE